MGHVPKIFDIKTAKASFVLTLPVALALLLFESSVTDNKCGSAFCDPVSRIGSAAKAPALRVFPACYWTKDIVVRGPTETSLKRGILVAPQNYRSLLIFFPNNEVAETT